MKHIYVILASLLLTSCTDDLLDTKPYNKYTEDVIWNDEKLAQGFIYNTQSEALTEYIVSPLEIRAFAGSCNDDFSDNMIVMASMQYIADISRDILTIDKDYGWGSFDIIRDANLIIDRAQKSTSLKPDRIKFLVAQGKMLRAIVYFKKAKVFGKYILIDKVLEPDDEFQLPRSKTIKETYDFIIKDLTEAAEDLPEVAPAGALTKGAAYAMCAEVALQAASYAESGADDYFDIAKEMSENLFALTGAGYALDNDYKKLFNDFDYAQNSKEIILGWFRSKDNLTFRSCFMLHNVCNLEFDRIHDFATPALTESYLGWGKRVPSLDLVNEYEVMDEDGKAKKWNETSYFKNFRPGVDYVSNVFFKNRDERFYASIVYDSTMYFKNLVTMRDKGNLHYKSTQKPPANSTQSGFWMRKSIYESQQVSADKYTDAHLILFRLGRAYLNYAEVMLRKGDKATAIEYINKTRTTHGGLPELPTSLSEAEAWKAYKSERRVELFFESDRYWSLLRWGKYDGLDIIPELNHAHQRLEIAEDGRSFEIMDLPVGNSHLTNTKVFSKRRYLFPVPQKEILQNEQLAGDQNPLW